MDWEKFDAFLDKTIKRATLECLEQLGTSKFICPKDSPSPLHETLVNLDLVKSEVRRYTAESPRIEYSLTPVGREFLEWYDQRYSRIS